MPVPRQVQHAADQHHGSRQNHAGAQQRADDDLDALIVPASSFFVVIGSPLICVPSLR